MGKLFHIYVLGVQSIDENEYCINRCMLQVFWIQANSDN